MLELPKLSKMDQANRTILRNLGLDAQLEQGQWYVRQGHVLNISLEKNCIMAQIQETSLKSYEVKIRLKSFPGEIWDMIITTLAQQATLAAVIIDGELSLEIDKLLQNAGISLFPQSPKEFITECSCPAIPRPCKHIAATFCILAQEFLKNPFVMFILRGKSQDMLLANLIEKRAQMQQDSTELLPDVPLADKSLSPDDQAEIICNYWQTPDRLDAIHFEEEIPPASCHPLQVLGTPPGWPAGISFSELMHPFYEHVNKKYGTIIKQ